MDIDGDLFSQLGIENPAYLPSGYITLWGEVTKTGLRYYPSSALLEDIYYSRLLAYRKRLDENILEFLKHEH